MWKPSVNIGMIASRLQNYLLEGSIYVMGVSQKVERAQIELQLTLAFLKDSRINGEETLRVLVLQIMDAAHTLENQIEKYGLVVASRRGLGFKNIIRRYACIFTEGIYLYNVGKEIDKTIDKLANLREIFHSYGVISEKHSVSSKSCLKEQMRRTYSHVLDRELVGLEAQTEEVMKRLVDEKSDCGVLVVWGMAGLGKTTLVKHVYHDSMVRGHFSKTAWVCVSPHFCVREIWDQIYYKLLSPTKCERKENSKLGDDFAKEKEKESGDNFAKEKKKELGDDNVAKKLYSLLQDTDANFLIVLDDIWSTDAWDILKSAFPLGESKLRLVITTRNKAIVYHVGRSYSYQPQTLDRDQSFKLFQMRANFDFGVNTTMQRVRDEMLKQCGGLPLAINMLASLLARKNTLTEWERVCENVSGYIAEYGGPFWVIALSYDDLPHHLKACFLYFCNFPKNAKIPVKLLIKLWIAEGFVLVGEYKKGLGDQLEDIGYSYVNELVERCVIHLEDDGSAGTIKTCRIHSLMRELCLIKAGEENFLTSEYRSAESVSPYKVLQSQHVEKARRLIIHLNKDFNKLVLSKVERGDQIRSLFCSGSIGSQKVMLWMFKNLQSLRVLKVEGVGSEDGECLTLPKEIGNMIHLRFLSFKGSRIKSFPSFIGSLILLQTLDFRIIYIVGDSLNIPNILWKLEHLRHLYLPRDYVANHKLHLSTIRNLQSFVPVSSDNCMLEDLASLGSLRKLGFVVENHPFENLEDLWRSAGSNLKEARTLSLDNKLGVVNCPKIGRILSSFSGVYKVKLVGCTVDPFIMYPFQNLMKLSLCNTELPSGQMGSIESLPRLRALKLELQAFDENCEVLTFSSVGFPELNSLSFYKVGRVSKWVVDEGAMPKLTRLSIIDCCDMKELPDGLQSVATLKKLIVSETLHSRVEDGGPDFYKIKHVPFYHFFPTPPLDE